MTNPEVTFSLNANKVIAYLQKSPATFTKSHIIRFIKYCFIVNSPVFTVSIVLGQSCF